MMRLFAGTPWDIPPRCERCGELEAACRCPPPAGPSPVRVAPAAQTARLAVEKRARGKSVTVVRGLLAADNDLPSLLAELKAACGAGGALKEDLLEIQGLHLDRIRALLVEKGYRTKG